MSDTGNVTRWSLSTFRIMWAGDIESKLANGERFVISRGGKDICVVVPMSWFLDDRLKDD